METQNKVKPILFSKKDKKETKELVLSDIYSKCLLNRNILLPITSVGENIKETIQLKISNDYEGMCIQEGFIKRDSTQIVSYSSGIVKGNNIHFSVVFKCDCFFPVEGMLIECIAKNITKAGIQAESFSETPSPFVAFVARDYSYSSKLFANIQEKDKFIVKVIGQRFELNDKYISIIGEIYKHIDIQK
jgi:DNA-directed RNA polymerase subunit E'/Rpb7